MRRLSFLIAIVLVVVIALSVITSNGAETSLRGYWAKVYNGNYVRGGVSALVKTENGIYLVGGISFPNSDKGFIARLSEEGEVSKAVGYGVMGLDCMFEGGAALGRNLMVAGILHNGTFGNRRLMIAKIGENMKPLWAETFNISVFPELAGIEVVDDGILVAGGFVGEKDGVLVMKLNDKGEVLWTRLYISEGFLVPTGMAPDGEGGFLLLGVEVDYGSSKMVLIDIDGKGKVKWAKAYKEGVYGNAILKEGERIIVVGEIGNGLEGENRGDVFVALLNEDGNVIWAKAYGSEEMDFGGTAGLLDGGIVVAGIYGGKIVSGIPPRVENYTIWILNLEKNGKVRWEKAYWRGYPSFVVPDGDSILIGGFLISGNESRIFLARIKGDGSSPDSGITPGYNVHEVRLKATNFELREEELKVKALPVEFETQNIPLEAEPIRS